MEKETVLTILKDCYERQTKNSEIETTIVHKNSHITGKLPAEYIVSDTIVKLENGDNCSYIPVNEITEIACAVKSESPRITF